MPVRQLQVAHLLAAGACGVSVLGLCSAAHASGDVCAGYAVRPDTSAPLVHGYPRGEVHVDTVVGVMLLSPTEGCSYHWDLTLTDGDETTDYSFTTSSYEDHHWVDADLQPGRTYQASLGHQFTVQPHRWSFTTTEDPSELSPVSLRDIALTVNVKRRPGGFVGSWALRDTPTEPSSDRVQLLTPTGEVFSESPIHPDFWIEGARFLDNRPDQEEVECVDYVQVTPNGVPVDEGWLCDGQPSIDPPRCGCRVTTGPDGWGVLTLPILIFVTRRRRR